MLNKSLKFERLEDRRLLAIVWANEFATGTDAPNFDVYYQANERIARETVNRAIADWNKVILDQNYDFDSNPNTNNLPLKIFAGDLAQLINKDVRGATDITAYAQELNPNWRAGTPAAATIYLDDNAQGQGWFFDQTPQDDAEFTAIVNSGSDGTGAAFHASFVDSSTTAFGYSDLYRTVVHEIGHALGISDDPMAAISARLKPVFRADNNFRVITTSGFLSLYDGVNLDAMFADEHLYEGPTGTSFQVYTDSPSAAFTLFGHPRELMNSGNTVPADPPPGSISGETTRQFISDLDVFILVDAYGYSALIPSQVNSAHVTLDSQTGTLLVQGGVTSAGVALADSIVIDTIGSDIRVSLFNSSATNYATERIPAALVRQIVVSRAGDFVSVPNSLVVNGIGVPVHHVYSVVSTNQDMLDPGSLTDNFVDLNTVIPGAQVSLRAAIQNGNNAEGTAVYVPRGNYRLTLPGTDTVFGTEINQGDLDIRKSTIIIGTGAGETIIDAGGVSGIGDRVFELSYGSGAGLTLDSLTVTGGRAPSGLTTGNMHGGGIFVRNSTTLNLRNSAVVGNQTTNTTEAIGGGIYFEPTAGHFITNSVITDNHSARFTGGVFLGGTDNTAIVTVTDSIIAGNTAALEFNQGFDVGVQSGVPGRQFTTGGNNRLGNAAPGFVHNSNGDFIAAAAGVNLASVYVVTGIADTYDRSNDGVVRSLRDAIDLANTTAGAQEVWLPAWDFMLTRDRYTFDLNGPTDLTDTSAAFGDLDVGKGSSSTVGGSLTIRGVHNETTVAWQAGKPVDKVFELLGDYNNDGVIDIEPADVDSSDWIMYRKGTLAADGNDDGVVTSADGQIYDWNFGTQLMLIDIS